VLTFGITGEHYDPEWPIFFHLALVLILVAFGVKADNPCDLTTVC
jgi:hypothetical protein